MIQDRSQIAYVEFEKGEEYKPHARTFQVVSAEIQQVRNHYRAVTKALAASNLRTTIEWKGEKISIVEALELVKQLRAEAEMLQEFGSSQQVERIERGAFDANVVYKKALFDPLRLKSRLKKPKKKPTVYRY